jgi:hypothetical protein
MKIRNVGYAVVVAATAAAFILGSVGAGEAKGKKKHAAPVAAAASTPSNICVMPYGPVCAMKGKDGLKFTYANACYAKAEGAKIVSQKACPPAKAMKAMKAGKKKAKKAMK